MIFISKAKSRVQGKKVRGFSLVRCEQCDSEVEMRNDHWKKAKSCKNCVNKTHGKTNTRLFRIWQGMINRVRNNPASYSDIKLYINSEWGLSFEAFEKWAIKSGYSDYLSIDRIDNKKGYEPSNCRWANSSVQQNNKREIQSNNTSGYKGVSKQGNKWRAGKTINKKSICFGLYNTKEEAIESYKENTK